MKPKRKSQPVALGRPSILEPLASQLNAIKSPRLRGRVTAALLNKYAGSLDVSKAIPFLDEMRHLGLLINQSLRFSNGLSVNAKAIKQAVQRINSLP